MACVVRVLYTLQCLGSVLRDLGPMAAAYHAAGIAALQVLARQMETRADHVKR
jgi:hypothetical protein